MARVLVGEGRWRRLRYEYGRSRGKMERRRGNGEAREKKQYLNGFESVRYALYRNSPVIKESYGKDRVEVRQSYLNHDDVAFRAAAYSKLSLNADEITHGYEKDGLVAFEYIIRNWHVWKDEKSRQALHDICWDADTKYNNNYLDCANHFNWKKAELEKEHPEWFIEKLDDAGESAEADESKTVLSVSIAKELLSDANTNPSLQYLAQIHAIALRMQGEIGKQKWILWGVVVLIVFELYKR